MNPKYKYVFVHGIEHAGIKEDANSITEIIELCKERINFSEELRDVVVAYVYVAEAQNSIVGTIMFTENGLAFV